MTDIAYIALGAVAGMAFGGVHFLTLARVVRLLVSGPAALGLGLQLMRFAVLGGALYWIAQLGGLPLLAALGGVLVARVLVLRLGKPSERGV